MKIQNMGDLHMEFAENSRYLKNVEFPVTGDILVLAGDTFYLNNTTAPLSKFWRWASGYYRQVLLVPGNHEYYQGCDIMGRELQWRWMFMENTGYYQNQIGYVFENEHLLNGLYARKCIELLRCPTQIGYLASPNTTSIISPAITASSIRMAVSSSAT